MVQPEAQAVGWRDADRAWGGRNVSQPGKPVDHGARNWDLLVLHRLAARPRRQALRRWRAAPEGEAATAFSNIGPLSRSITGANLR